MQEAVKRFWSLCIFPRATDKGDRGSTPWAASPGVRAWIPLDCFPMRLHEGNVQEVKWLLLPVYLSPDGEEKAIRMLSFHCVILHGATSHGVHWEWDITGSPTLSLSSSHYPPVKYRELKHPSYEVPKRMKCSQISLGLPVSAWVSLLASPWLKASNYAGLWYTVTRLVCLPPFFCGLQAT